MTNGNNNRPFDKCGVCGEEATVTWHHHPSYVLSYCDFHWYKHREHVECPRFTLPEGFTDG